MSASDMWSRPIVIYRGGFADNEPAVPDFSAEDLVSFLTQFPDAACDAATCVGKTCSSKTGALSWSPAVIAEGETRANEAVEAIHYLVFDLDHVADGELERIRANFTDYEHVVHTTHSHAPGDGAYRLVLPVDRPILPGELRAVREAVVRALEIPADPSCKDLSRLYACPTQRGGVEPWASHWRGEAIRVDEALEIARQLGQKVEEPRGQTAAEVAPTKGPAPAAEYDIAELRDRLSKARRSKAQGDERSKEQAEVLGRVLEGKPLADVGGRHHARVRATGLLAYWLPSNCPWEVARELMRASLDATPIADGESREAALEKTRVMYEDAMRGRVAADERRAEENARLKRIADRILEKIGAGSAAAAKEFADAAGVTADEGSEEFERAWQEQLLLSREGVRGCEYNAHLLLACAEEVRGTIRWNEVTKQVEISGGPLGGVHSDQLPSAAAAFAQKHYDFQGGAALMGPALVRVARANPRDPIAEWLDELAWDGEKRLDTALETYFGVIPRDGEQEQYVRAVSRRWFISLVARALKPGCKVDTVLILEGAQGKRKSSGLAALVGHEFFLDTALDVGSKDSMQAIASTWLVELGELASLRSAETNRVKQYVSAQFDKYRPPYGATMIEAPRRCLFVGTCNPEEGAGYLRDRTGNRRYWPVRVVNDVDLEGIARDRELLLAEAVRAFREGERWWLAADEERIARAETDERMEEDSTISAAIERWWFAMRPEQRPKVVSALDAAEQALRLSASQCDYKIRVEIGRALGNMHFERTQRRGAGGERRWVFLATEELLKAPQQTAAARASGLALLAGKDNVAH